VACYNNVSKCMVSHFGLIKRKHLEL